MATRSSIRLQDWAPLARPMELFFQEGHAGGNLIWELNGSVLQFARTNFSVARSSARPVDPSDGNDRGPTCVMKFLFLPCLMAYSKSEFSSSSPTAIGSRSAAGSPARLPPTAA
eukprot:9246579-Pyramimonas_sp.AAC.1